MPLFMHYQAFLPAVAAFADEAQAAYWKERTQKFEVIGCYVQTEMGHGKFYIFLREKWKL